MRLIAYLIFAFTCFTNTLGQSLQYQKAKERKFNFQIASGLGYKNFDIKGFHFSVCPLNIDSTPVAYRNEQNLNIFSPYVMANGSVKITGKFHFQLMAHLSYFQIIYDNYLPQELNNCPAFELTNLWTDVEMSKYLFTSGIGIAYQPFNRLSISMGVAIVYERLNWIDYTLVLTVERKNFIGIYESFSHYDFWSPFYWNCSYQFYKSFLLNTSFYFRNRFVNVGVGYQF